MKTATAIFLRHAVERTQSQLADCLLKDEPLTVHGAGAKTLAMILELALERLDDVLAQQK